MDEGAEMAVLDGWDVAATADDETTTADDEAKEAEVTLD